MDFFEILGKRNEAYINKKNRHHSEKAELDNELIKLTARKQRTLKEGTDMLSAIEAKEKDSVERTRKAGLKELQADRDERFANIEITFSERKEYLQELKEREEELSASRQTIESKRERFENRIAVNQLKSQLEDARFDLLVKKDALENAKMEPDKPQLIRWAESRVAAASAAVTDIEEKIKALEKNATLSASQPVQTNEAIESINRRIASTEKKELAAKEAANAAYNEAAVEVDLKANESMAKISEKVALQKRMLTEQNVEKSVQDEYDDVRCKYASKLNELTAAIKDCEVNIERLNHDQSLSEFLRQSGEELTAAIDPSLSRKLGTVDFSAVTDLPKGIVLGQVDKDWRSSPIVPALAEAGYSFDEVGAGVAIYADLHSIAGNVIVHAGGNTANDPGLNRIIACWIMKFYESIPLGNLKVEFLEFNKNILFESFKSAFKQNQSMFTLRTGQMEARSMIESLEKSATAMRNTFSAEITNIGELYQLDKDNAVMHLVVIRNGLDNFLRIGSDDYFRFLNLLGESGNQVGIRFLIVDDRVPSAESWRNENHVEYDRAVENFTSIIYTDGGITYKEDALLPPSVPDGMNIQGFISETCGKMDKLMEKLHNVPLPLEEIGFGTDYGDEDTHNFITLDIPIGKYGQYVFSAKLTCHQENGILNQGYIAMGGSGKGKSSFMHSIILNGAMKYSPEDLNFWLLDFKDGAATGVYMNANIPHIHLLSMKNKPADALILLQQIKSEMETRNTIFKSVAASSGHNTAFSDLYDYNKYVDANPGTGNHLPRVVILIDEAQEMYLDDASAIGNDMKEISSIITAIAGKGRSVGVYLVIILQNLSLYKTSLLKDAFVNQVRGRVCFGINEQNVVESGFGDGYRERKGEISELGRGFAMCQNMNTEPIQKVKIAYADPNRYDEYFARIREKYSTFKAETLVLGDTSPLYPTKKITGSQSTYMDAMMNIQPKKDRYHFILGENATTLYPFECSIRKGEKGGLVAVGSDAHLMSSVAITTTVCAINTPNSRVFACNGNGRNDLLQALLNDSGDVQNLCVYKAANIHLMLAALYRIYLKRKAAQEREEDLDDSPIFVMIHNAPALSKLGGEPFNFSRSFVDEYCAALASDDPGRESNGPDTDRAFYEANLVNKRADSLLMELVTNGNGLNIFVSFTMSDFSNHSLKKIADDMSNLIVFNNYNSTNNPSSMTMSVRSILTSIKKGDDDSPDADDDETNVTETMALAICGGTLSKFRPIIYTESMLKES